jgi:hypothetical protein
MKETSKTAHTAEPWPLFDDRSDAVQHHPDLCFMPANDAAEMHSLVRMSLVDYLRARVCVNACAGVPSESLQGLDGGYGQAVESAVNGLNEALEIIGPTEGEDETSDLLKSVRLTAAVGTTEEGFCDEEVVRRAPARAD